MEYFFINVKIITAFFLLIMLPGMLLMSLLRERIVVLDMYEKISYGLVSGMAFWVPITWVSFGFGLDTQNPVYISIAISCGLLLLYLYKTKINLQKIFVSFGQVPSYFNIYIAIIIIQAILIGYTSQYQTSNSDALAHLAAIRNLVSSETVFNCDHLFGYGSSIVNTYGCNPWYLTLASVIKLANVDTALTYSTIIGVVYFLSVLAIYSLFKAISGNIFTSKVGSIIFTVISLIIWLIDNENTTYNLNSHWVVFPQAIVNYVLFPIMLAVFVRYIVNRDRVFLMLTVLFLFVLTRFHPNWLIWAPIVISGIVIFRNMSIGKNGVAHKINYKIIFLFGSVSVVSALSYILCIDTYIVDSNFISPMSLWGGSGGNLLYISDYIYLYNPKDYFMSRGYFDLITIGLLWYMHSKGKVGANELLVIFKGFLIVVFLIIFNPFIVVPFVKILGTSIPLYRAFELFWPSLSVFTIYSILISLRLKSIDFPALPKIAISVVAIFTLLFFSNYASFLIGVYQNEGEYYDNSKSPPYFSTSKSLYEEPFSTLRTLGQEKIAVRTPLANVVAALTNLDPITTEKFRYPTLVEFQVREQENDSLLLFNKSHDQLKSILKKRRIRYIIIKSSELNSILNFKKYPDLVRFKVTAGSDEVWEVNEIL